MSYLDAVEAELVDKLKNDANTIAELTSFFRAKLLESYKNGAQAARKQMQQHGQNKNSKARK